MGLVRKSSAPASSPLVRSWWGSSDVTMTTGKIAVAGFAADPRHTSYPLISGIMTSRSTRSGRSAWILSSASGPDDAVSTR